MYKSSLKVAIIETSSVLITKEDVDKVLNHKVEYTPSNDSGLVGTLMRILFLRNVYRQMNGGLLNIFIPQESTNTIVDETKKTENILDIDAYDELFTYLSELEKEYGTQILIFYNPIESRRYN